MLWYFLLFCAEVLRSVCIMLRGESVVAGYRYQDNYTEIP